MKNILYFTFLLFFFTTNLHGGVKKTGDYTDVNYPSSGKNIQKPRAENDKKYPLSESFKPSTGSEKCKKCHPIIFAEWLRSPHAKSYISEEFSYETNKYDTKFCLPCHIPKGLALPKLEARINDREEGIGCPSCHLDGAFLLSSHSEPSKDHKKRRKHLIVGKSLACSPCHKTNWNEVKKFKAKKTKTCQDCHMPKIIRKNPAKPYQAKTYDHSFSVFKTEDYSKIISLNIDLIDISNDFVNTLIEIENLGAHHSLPSSDFGYNELLVTVELKDEMDITVDHTLFSILVERKNVLFPKKKSVYQAALSDSKHVGVALHVRLLKVSFDRKDRLLLAEARRSLY